jgi:hypothetical protein
MTGKEIRPILREKFVRRTLGRSLRGVQSIVADLKTSFSESIALILMDIGYVNETNLKTKPMMSKEIALTWNPEGSKRRSAEALVLN